MYKRHFKNYLPDYSTSGQNEGNCDFVQDLIKSYVQQIEQRFKPAPQNTDEGTGLYVGVAGIAFMFLKMACSKCFQEKRQELLAKAFTYIKVENCNSWRHRSDNQKVKIHFTKWGGGGEVNQWM